MKEINPIATQIANSPSAKLAAKLADNPMVKAATQMANNPMVKAATPISRIAQPYAEALQKFSHIEWIGKIPKHWGMCRIKNWASFINGFAFKSNELTTDKLVPVIRISDIQNGNLDYTSCLTFDYSNRLQAYLIKHNDIIIAMSGATTGKTALVKSDAMAYINQRVGIIRNAEKYIYYCLNTDMFSEYVNLLSAGSAQPNISMGQILNFSIPYISKEKQQAIADYLDGECARIDSIVEKQRQIIERLKEYKKSVITEAVTKGLNPNTPMKDSGIGWIGKIPELWEISKLKYYSKYITDGTHATPEYLADGIPFLSIKDISAGKLDFSNTKYISQQQHEELSKHAPIEKGDILFTRIGTLGVSVIVETDTAFDIFVSVGLLKPKDNINTKYLNYVMNSEYYYQYIQLVKAGEGTSAAKFNLSDVSNSPIVCPSLSEQQEIADYLDKKCVEIDSIVEKRERMIELMTEYKKSLIYECVTGKKEIVDVME